MTEIREKTHVASKSFEKEVWDEWFDNIIKINLST